MANALFRGYFAEGRDLNDPEDLIAMAADAGLDPDEVRTFLAGDSGTQEERAGERAGRAPAPSPGVEDELAQEVGRSSQIGLRRVGPTSLVARRGSDRGS